MLALQEHGRHRWSPFACRHCAPTPRHSQPVLKRCQRETPPLIWQRSAARQIDSFEHHVSQHVPELIHVLRGLCMLQLGSLLLLAWMRQQSARITPAGGSQISVKRHTQTRPSCQHKRAPNQLLDSTFQWFSDISFLVSLSVPKRASRGSLSIVLSVQRNALLIPGFDELWAEGTWAELIPRPATTMTIQSRSLDDDPRGASPYWNDSQLNSLKLRSEPRRAQSQLHSKSVRGADSAAQ